MDVLVANIIPTSKYFESRFDHMQQQLNEVKDDLKDFRGDVDRRFEQVDKRFEQVDQRFQHLEDKIDRLIERIDVKVDSGLKETRIFSVRLFTFAITFSAISVVGLFGRRTVKGKCYD